MAHETVRDVDTPDSLLAARQRQASYSGEPRSRRGTGVSSPAGPSTCPRVGPTQDGSVGTSSVFRLGNPAARVLPGQVLVGVREERWTDGARPRLSR
jgi:hypothetical protein